MDSLPYPHSSIAVTVCVMAWSMAAFAYLRANPEAWNKVGYSEALGVWDGKYYTLITSVCLHVGIIHLVFNLWWFWTLGRVMEKTLGTVRYVGFLLLSALVSSGCQMAIAGETGVGLSGIIYAMAAYMWVGKRRLPWFEIVDNSTAKWLVSWFVLCLVLTATGEWNIANVAHGSGLVFGLAIGFLLATRQHRAPAAATAVAMLVFTVVTMFWCPWAYKWRMHEASVVLNKQQYAKAEQMYTELLESDNSVGLVWWKRAVARRELGRIAESESDFETAKFLDPSLRK